MSWVVNCLLFLSHSDFSHSTAFTDRYGKIEAGGRGTRKVIYVSVYLQLLTY